MRDLQVAVLLAVAASSTMAQQATRRGEHRLVLAGATVIDVTGKSPRSSVDIVIQNERIVDITKTGRPRPADARIIDVSGAFVIPGLWDMHVHLQPYALPLLVANGVTTVRDMGGDAMHAAGVRLLAGTDLGIRDVFPGSSLHEELAWLVKIGLSPLQALQAATVNAAKALGRDSTSGSVDIGKVADLVVLSANPLEEIGNVREIRFVVLRGRLIGRAELDALIAEAERTASQR